MTTEHTMPDDCEPTQEEPGDDEQLLTVRKVQDELGGISGELVRKLLRQGAFPRAFKIGADWIVPEGDVTDDVRYRYGPGGPHRRPGPPRRDPSTGGCNEH